MGLIVTMQLVTVHLYPFCIVPCYMIGSFCSTSERGMATWTTQTNKLVPVFMQTARVRSKELVSCPRLQQYSVVYRKLVGAPYTWWRAGLSFNSCSRYTSILPTCFSSSILPVSTSTKVMMDKPDVCNVLKHTVSQMERSLCWQHTLDQAVKWSEQALVLQDNLHCVQCKRHIQQARLEQHHVHQCLAAEDACVHQSICISWRCIACVGWCAQNSSHLFSVTTRAGFKCPIEATL